MTKLNEIVADTVFLPPNRCVLKYKKGTRLNSEQLNFLGENVHKQMPESDLRHNKAGEHEWVELWSRDFGHKYWILFDNDHTTLTARHARLDVEGIPEDIQTLNIITTSEFDRS
ncbi:hypothetical protein M1403_00545 [Patescibacteria group bacterium]|nr:hypothetical protein [Patescibacteria group bacterium]